MMEMDPSTLDRITREHYEAMTTSIKRFMSVAKHRPELLPMFAKRFDHVASQARTLFRMWEDEQILKEYEHGQLHKKRRVETSTSSTKSEPVKDDVAAKSESTKSEPVMTPTREDDVAAKSEMTQTLTVIEDDLGFNADFDEETQLPG